MSHRERIGQAIATLRKEKGLTQEQLSERAGLSRINLSKIENGRYNVSIDILNKVCIALDGELTIKGG